MQKGLRTSCSADILCGEGLSGVSHMEAEALIHLSYQTVATAWHKSPAWNSQTPPRTALTGVQNCQPSSIRQGFSSVDSSQHAQKTWASGHCHTLTGINERHPVAIPYKSAAAFSCWMTMQKQVCWQWALAAGLCIAAGKVIAMTDDSPPPEYRKARGSRLGKVMAEYNRGRNDVTAACRLDQTIFNKCPPLFVWIPLLQQVSIEEISYVQGISKCLSILAEESLSMICTVFSSKVLVIFGFMSTYIADRALPTSI